MSSDNDLCIRGMDGRIIALCVGMSQEEQDDCIRRNIALGAHYSTLVLKRPMTKEPGRIGVEE